VAADVLAVLLPLILATRGLAGGCECAAVKSTAIVVNVARGWVIGRGVLHEHSSRQSIASHDANGRPARVCGASAVCSGPVA